jgi:hypothetical protein
MFRVVHWLMIPHLIEIKYKDGCVCENCSKALSFIPSPCPRPSMRFYSLHVHLRDVEAGLKTPDSEKPNSDRVRYVPGPGVILRVTEVSRLVLRMPREKTGAPLLLHLEN